MVVARGERIKHDMYSGKNISIGMYLCLARLEEEIGIDGRQGVGRGVRFEGKWEGNITIRWNAYVQAGAYEYAILLYVHCASF